MKNYQYSEIDGGAVSMGHGHNTRRDWKQIRVTEETHRRLCEVLNKMQVTSWETYSFDKTINALITSWTDKQAEIPEA